MLDNYVDSILGIFSIALTETNASPLAILPYA